MNHCKICGVEISNNSVNCTRCDWLLKQGYTIEEIHMIIKRKGNE
jgi:predicted Rdx family selenoprotein